MKCGLCGGDETVSTVCLHPQAISPGFKFLAFDLSSRIIIVLTKTLSTTHDCRLLDKRMDIVYKTPRDM